MIRFAPTTESLKLVTAAAQSLHCDVSWLEDDAVADTVVDGSSSVNVATATTTTIMAAGAANKSRRLQSASFTNKGAAVNSITVNKDVSAALTQLAQANLSPGEALRYHSNRGWICYDADGREKQAPVGSQIYVTNALTQIVLGADVTNNNAVANTMADVTGLSFGVNAGETYYFKAVINYTSAAVTTGSRWAINGPAATGMTYTSRLANTATSETVNYNSAYDLPAAAGANSLLTGNMAVVEGFITPSAAGTFAIRFASEIASSAIVAKAGSRLEWMRVL
jgi:hypothetical protein